MNFSKKGNTNNIVLLLKYKDIIKFINADSYKKHCYLLYAELMMDYKEYDFIIDIKANIYFSICHILSKERK